MHYFFIFLVCISVTRSYGNPESILGSVDTAPLQRFGAWIPLPFKGTVAPTVPAATNLTPAESAALQQLNTFRTIFGASPLAWDAALARSASACTAEHITNGNLVACTQCTAEYSNVHSLDQLPLGSFAAIADPTSGWFSQYVTSSGAGGVNWNNPPFSTTYAAFAQVIWKSTTTVGCAHSTTSTTNLAASCPDGPCWVFVCCYNPAGNNPATMAQNVQDALRN